MNRKGNVSLAALRRSLPESNTDAELKGGSERAFFITMINIFTLVRAFFSSSHVSVIFKKSLFLYQRKQHSVHLQDVKT